MKRYMFVLAAFSVAILSLAIGSIVLAQSAPSNQSGSASSQVNQTLVAPLAPAGDDSNPSGPPEILIPKEYQPSAASAAQETGSTIFFTPQDENSSTTVLFLYNTDSITHAVGLQTFYINGSLTISTTIAVPPNNLVRVCSDSVSTVSASWSKVVLVNFTTFSAYGKLSVPTGVKVDGYVAWDTTGVYDPLSSLQTLPLRFSSDPSMVFLPAVAH